MRMLEKRLRRLEEGMLPPAETAASRRLYEMVLHIRRCRTARLGLSVPEDHHEPGWGGMSLGDIIQAGRQRWSAV